VAADFREFLSAVEEVTEEEVVALNERTKLSFTETAGAFKAHSVQMLDQMVESAENHARKLLEQHTDMQSLTVSSLTEKTRSLVNDLHAKSQEVMDQVAQEISAHVASVLKDIQQDLQAQGKNVMAAQGENIRLETQKLFSKLEARVTTVETNVQQRSEKVLEHLHKRIKERMPSPFLPANTPDARIRESADAEAPPQRR